MSTDKSLRIVHCFRSPVGGIFRHVRDLVLEHSAAGHKVGIVCDSSTGGSYEDALFDEIRPHLELGLTRMPIDRTPGIGDIRAFWTSYKEIRRLQPDILHGHGAKGGAIARLSGSALRAKKYRVARLYSPHGGSLHFKTLSPSGMAVLILEWVLGFMTDAVVFVCDFERRAYSEKIGKPRRSDVIFNGIRDSEFSPIEPQTEQADFLYIGMMRDLKGPDIFIDAFAEAERRCGRQLSALMVGDGPEKSTYEGQATRLGVKERIEIMPATKPRLAFSQARLVVVPSRAEALPYIVLEAVAAGIPVIASSVGGIPEVLGANNPGLFSPGDANALAQRMVEALNNADWTQRAKPDLARFEAQFSSRKMAADMLELYRDLLS